MKKRDLIEWADTSAKVALIMVGVGLGASVAGFMLAVTMKVTIMMLFPTVETAPQVPTQIPYLWPEHQQQLDRSREP